MDDSDGLPSVAPTPSLKAKTIGRLPLVAEPPSLVPARMINEAAYCIRLAYLEWAQGEFADNVFTLDGRRVHRRVDRGRGGLPDADEASEDEPMPFAVRSVWLGSEELGITAKIDLVEGEGERAVPVEYKRGRDPGLASGAFLPERVQLCAQVLLLRAHGYECEYAEIWYAADRRRVRVPIDEDLEGYTLRLAAELREVSASGKIPDPLQDDPKCRGCSLAGICLPDEVSLLKGLAGEPLDPDPEPEVEQLTFSTLFDLEGPLEEDPWGLAVGAPAPEPEPEVEKKLRPLVPARDERVPVYVQAQGAKLSLDGDRLRISARGALPEAARLPLTSHVVLFGNAQISTQAIAALLDRDIPIFFYSSGGWFRGRTSGHGSKNIELRVAQHRAAGEPSTALALATRFIAAKIRNCRTLLRRNHPRVSSTDLRELEFLAKKAEKAESLPSLLGLEGTAARLYFQSFTGMLKGSAATGAFDWQGRNRRPPRDPINAALSMAYALLTKDCALAASAAGLDPLLGFLHQPRYGRPALALDLMEEMRPLLADSTVITALNTGALTEDHFRVTVAGAALEPAGRKRFIAAYERRIDQLITHPLFGYRISYRRVLEVQARLLGRFLTGEIDHYPAFRTR